MSPIQLKLTLFARNNLILLVFILFFNINFIIILILLYFDIENEEN